MFKFQQPFVYKTVRPSTAAIGKRKLAVKGYKLTSRINSNQIGVFNLGFRT